MYKFTTFFSNGANYIGNCGDKGYFGIASNGVVANLISRTI